MNKKFALFGIVVALWSFSLFVWSFASNKAAALFWARLLLICAAFIPPTFLHFVFILVGKDLRSNGVFKKILRYNYMFALALVSITFTPYFLIDVKTKLYFKFWPCPGMLFIPFLAYFISNVFYSHLLMYNSIKTATSNVVRNQIKYVFLGTLIGFIGGSTNYFLYYNINIPPVANVLVAVYVCTVAYAIARHHLMDIEIIIKKTLIFASLFTIVFGVFVGMTVLTQTFITGSKFLGFAISSVVIIFTVKPIENFLINATNKYLFQKKYDYRELLKTFATEVLTVIDLNRLTNMTVEKLSDSIRLKSCAVLLYDKYKYIYNVVASRGLKNQGLTFNKESALNQFLKVSQNTIIMRNEIDKLSGSEVLQKDLKKLDSEILFPLTVHDEMIGALSIGRKKSDEDYTQEDIDILLSLAKTEAIAIANARLFDELGKTQAEAAQQEKMAVIGTLAAGINHEICNPLGIIVAQNEALVLNYERGRYKDKTYEELFKRALDIMKKSIELSHRATGITIRLAGFAKPGKDPKRDAIDISEKVSNVMVLLGHEMELKHITFIKNIPIGLPKILVDSKQIEEIFFNLIRNSAQAMDKPHGSITVEARNKDDDWVIVDITDTGCGITEEGLAMLFNPFYTTKGPDKGTGLGLYIVRQIIENNGGRILVKSKFGEGTTFTLEFQKARESTPDAKI